MATAKRKPKMEEVGKDDDALPDVGTLRAFYREMLVLRRFEEKAGQLYGMGLIGGFCHLYIGQEAVAVGVQHALKEGDSVITGYRDHGHMLVTGMEARRVMAELTGRSDGYSKGKGGSMHMFARDKKFYGGHGIVGAQVPLGAGLAFAHKYRNDGGIAICYLGDGATQQGQVHEAFNMAALWKLPLLIIIENNQYGMGTSIKRSSAVPELYKRGAAFGIPGEAIDGMDVVKMHAAAVEAVGYVREGNGPRIIEAMTYRYRGHSMSDPAKYRTRDEVQQARTERDPIERLRKFLVDREMASEDELKAIDKEVRADINEAAQFAQDSPEPDPKELWTDVLIDA